MDDFDEASDGETVSEISRQALPSFENGEMEGPLVQRGREFAAIVSSVILRFSETTRSEMGVSDSVDLRLCKQEVSRLYPPGNMLRELLMSEPDELPRAEGIAKLQTYARIALFSRRHRLGSERAKS